MGWIVPVVRATSEVIMRARLRLPVELFLAAARLLVSAARDDVSCRFQSRPVIDGPVVLNGPGRLEFDSVVISVSGSVWRANTTAYYTICAFAPR